jgi:hypothetical protein
MDPGLLHQALVERKRPPGQQVANIAAGGLARESRVELCVTVT